MNIKIVSTHEGTQVLLGTTPLPGVVHVAFSADREGTETLLILRGVEVMLEADNQLVDIETTPLPGLEEEL